MTEAPKFGTWVRVKAIAQKVRTPLDDIGIAFKTDWERVELETPLVGTFSRTALGKSGVTDIYLTTKSYLEDEPKEGHRHFIPSGESYRLWMIDAEGKKGLTAAFPEDVELLFPERSDEHFEAGALVEINEEYPGYEYWGQLAIVANSYEFVTHVRFILPDMQPTPDAAWVQNDHLTRVMSAGELSEAYPDYAEKSKEVK